MDIKHTVEPNNKPSLNQWMEEFNVSSRVVKHPELLERAKSLMEQYPQDAYLNVWMDHEDGIISYYKRRYLRELVSRLPLIEIEPVPCMRTQSKYQITWSTREQHDDR